MREFQASSMNCMKLQNIAGSGFFKEVHSKTKDFLKRYTSRKEKMMRQKKSEKDKDLSEYIVNLKNH